MVRRCHERRGSLLVEWFFTSLIAAWREWGCSKAADYQAFEQVLRDLLVNHRCGFVRTR